MAITSGGLPPPCLAGLSAGLSRTWGWGGLGRQQPVTCRAGSESL